MMNTDEPRVSILIATNNPGKFGEYAAIFAPLPVRLLTLKEVGLDWEVEESGTTFAENALLKARAYGQASGLPTLADDNGLEVVALGGEPGVFSARWAGPTDADRITALLDRLAKVPPERRQARFVCHTILRLPDGREIAGQGELPGTILFAPRGEKGFGYDPIFHVTEVGRTLGELTYQERVAVSHRSRAARQLLPAIKKLAGI